MLARHYILPTYGSSVVSSGTSAATLPSPQCYSTTQDCIVTNTASSSSSSHKSVSIVSFYSGTGDILMTTITLLQYFMVINWFRQASLDVDDERIVLKCDGWLMLFIFACLAYAITGVVLLHQSYAMFNYFHELSLTIVACIFLIGTL